MASKGSKGKKAAAPSSPSPAVAAVAAVAVPSVAAVTPVAAETAETKGEQKLRGEAINILNDARRALVDLIIKHVKVLHNVDLTSDTDVLIKQISEPAVGAKALAIANREKPRDLALPMHQISRKIPGSNPAKLAADLVAAIKADYSSVSTILADIVASGVYINFTLAMAYLGRVVSMIKDGSFLAPLSSQGRDRVMIEYSQPNTHKAFHVGHMRNAALGDSLVRCFEQVGHPVVAANYFGDEGQHIATCLWQLDRETKADGADLQTVLANVPEVERGEWLGGFYSRGVESLALDALTSQPYTGVVAAQIKSKGAHPSGDAPANWHLVEVAYGKETATVVCGGAGYEVGDLVAYVPVGAHFDGKVIFPMDKKGVLSHGIILAKRELGIEDDEPVAVAAAVAKKDTKEAAPKAAADKADKAAAKPKKEEKAAAPVTAAAATPAGDAPAKAGKGGKKEKKDAAPVVGEVAAPSTATVPATPAPVAAVTESGKKGSKKAPKGEASSEGAATPAPAPAAAAKKEQPKGQAKGKKGEAAPLPPPPPPPPPPPKTDDDSEPVVTSAKKGSKGKKEPAAKKDVTPAAAAPAAAVAPVAEAAAAAPVAAKKDKKGKEPKAEAATTAGATTDAAAPVVADAPVAAKKDGKGGKKDAAPKEEKKAAPSDAKKDGAAAAAAPAAAKKEKKEKPVDAANQIHVLNHLKGIKHGDVLTEFGRKVGAVPVGKTVDQEAKERADGTKGVLLKMEARDSYWHPLWHQTAAWSFAEFATIYKWLGLRFDHDFKESDVGEISLKMVEQLHAEGKLDELPSADGKFALGLDLEKRGFKGYGFCLLRKSNGSGLYATKDLSLAQVKFNDYKIDKSIYVVASEQSHHFKQVFKSLEVLGYEQAKKCYHLAYGMVRLPHGKMSSRKGTVIFFSTLKDMLWSYFVKHLFRHRAYRMYTSAEFLDALLFTLPSGTTGWYKVTIQKAIDFIGDQSMWPTSALLSFAKLFDSSSPKLFTKAEVSAKALAFTIAPETGDKWTTEEIHNAVHALSVATIKYGMLNQNCMTDIVFDLESWAKHTGNTGPYLLMAYARMRAIIRNVSARSDISIAGVKADYSLFEEKDDIDEKDKLPQQRALLLKINEFWPTLQDSVVKNYNPAQLCDYLSSLCREFSSWYEAVPYLTKEMNPPMLVTRLQLIEALSLVLQKGLALLGIPTLERV